MQAAPDPLTRLSPVNGDNRPVRKLASAFLDLGNPRGVRSRLGRAFKAVQQVMSQVRSFFRG